MDFSPEPEKVHGERFPDSKPPFIRGEFVQHAEVLDDAAEVVDEVEVLEHGSVTRESCHSEIVDVIVTAGCVAVIVMLEKMVTNRTSVKLQSKS